MSNKFNNGDIPAYPQERALWVEGIGSCPTIATGLTKRERFAMAAMQGLCTTGGYHNYADLAHDAVRNADALLAELAKEKVE